jgi:hypothetical protein
MGSWPKSVPNTLPSGRSLVLQQQASKVVQTRREKGQTFIRLGLA